MNKKENNIQLSCFSRGDIDGFFGLFIDNVMQLMVIAALSSQFCGIPFPVVIGTILPASAFSVLFGNVYYTYQARQLAYKTGNPKVTALPYGINTVSIFAYIFFIMGPVYKATGDWRQAYALGLAACLFSGIMETAGAFVAEKIRRVTPRAALLSTLAAIAIGFISMDFVLRIFHRPAVAILPLGIILVQYFGRVSLPFKFPAGFLAIIVGTLLAWLPIEGIGFMTWNETEHVKMEWLFTLPDLLKIVSSAKIWDYMSIIIPMGLFNIIGSLQNIESAAAEGDEFETKSSLLVNGIGSIIAACLGSCFPTTIYIGHPGWKALGARQGYSIFNGIVITIFCIFGLMGYVLKLIPIEAGAPIVFWIAIVITAQAFQATDRSHASAVVIGLIPGIVAWGLFLVEQTLAATGVFTFYSLGLDKFTNTGLAAIDGLIKLERGFMFTCMIWAAISVYIIDKDFLRAAFWSSAATLLSVFGLIHAYKLTSTGTAYDFGFMVTPYITLGYFLFSTYLFFIFFLRKKGYVTDSSDI